MMDAKVYTVEAACEVYKGLEPRTLRKWCLTGYIKAKKAGSLWFIPAKELNKVLGA